MAMAPILLIVLCVSHSVPHTTKVELRVSFSCVGSVTCREAARRERYRAAEKAVRDC